MIAYSTEKVVSKDGTIQIESLPFPAGETVQVIILQQKVAQNRLAQRPLKGSVLSYEDPLEPVAQDDWTVLQ